MASSTKRIGFLEALQKCNLYDAATIEAILSRMPVELRDASRDRELAAELIRNGYLTEFQAKQLLAGRYKGFFLVNRYKILEPLGKGGMGTVFLCEHLVMRHKVAIKMLPKTDAKARNESNLRRFRREARAVAALNHPNIVRALEMEPDGPIPFLVLEYINGRSLLEIVETDGAMSLQTAIDCMRQTALGLQHAYEAGLIHRDIKPSNLLLDHNGTIKILDLGLVRLMNENDDLTKMENTNGAVLGTADYVSPEQAIDTSNADIRSDIYSLGCTFYFLLRGQPPFAGKNLQQKLLHHQTRDPEPIRNFRPDVPPGLADVLAKMLMKNPDERYQTPNEFAAALEPFIRNSGLPSSNSETQQAASLDSTTIELGDVALQPRSEKIARTAFMDNPLLDPNYQTPILEAGIPPTAESVLLGPRRQLGRQWVWFALGATAIAALIVGLALQLGEAPALLPTTGTTAKGTSNASETPKTAGDENEEFRKTVAALPIDKRWDAVLERLKERNPGYNPGTVTPIIEDGEIRELSLTSDNLTDVAPLQALSGLRKLRLNGSRPLTGKLIDPSPLRTLPLVELSLADNPRLQNVGSLVGLKLTSLDLSNTSVTDSMSLVGLNPTTLNLSKTRISTLDGLSGMTELRSLDIRDTPIDDLTPIAKLGIQVLKIDNIPVMDLLPLCESSLTEITLTLNPKFLEVLRRLPKLRTINGMPAAEYFKS